MTCNQCEIEIDPHKHVTTAEDLDDSVEIRYTCPECGSTFYAFIGDGDWQPLD